MRAVVDSFDRATLDSTVLSKPYFDRQGFILAVEGERPAGFVHAGFGPNQMLSDLDWSKGIISQLRIGDCESPHEVAKELLQRATDYLQSKGAREVRFGGYFPHAPFYLGLYGGSQLGGVLEEDDLPRSALGDFGFVESGKVLTFSPHAGWVSASSESPTDVASEAVSDLCHCRSHGDNLVGKLLFWVGGTRVLSGVSKKRR